MNLSTIKYYRAPFNVVGLNVLFLTACNMFAWFCVRRRPTFTSIMDGYTQDVQRLRSYLKPRLCVCEGLSWFVLSCSVAASAAPVGSSD